MDHKCCTKCGRLKTRAESHIRRKSPDGLRPKCKDCKKTEDRERYLSDPNARIAQATAWRKDNREHYNASRSVLKKRKRKTNPNYRLSENLRKRLWDALQGHVKRGSAIALLGCTVDFARRHIEAQWTSGMSWDSYGLWEVDHIRELDSFDLQDPVQLAVACHYTNLRPLWAPDNASRGGRYGARKRLTVDACVVTSSS